MANWFDSLVSALVFAGFLLVLRPILAASLASTDSAKSDDQPNRDRP